MIAVIIPMRTLLFTLHNRLTKRDYSYSIDDFCDLGLAACIFVWVYVFFNTKDIPVDEFPGITVYEDSDWYRFAWQAISKTDGDFKILVFLSCITIFMWVRFLLML